MKYLKSCSLFLIIVIFFPFVGGCTSTLPKEQYSTKNETTSISIGTPVNLTIVGFNYTDRDIYQYSVDGLDAGNIRVSTDSSGGGGSVCCAKYTLGTSIWNVQVKWRSGGCYYRYKSPVAEEFEDRIRPIYTEFEAAIEKEIGDPPRYLEIHIFKDGTVQAAITSTRSLPRLSLNKTREDKSTYPRCLEEK